MKAVICTRYGGPEVLEIREIEKPVPKENELCVRVYASAVNSGDVRVRSLAVPGWMKPIMRLVLGFSKPRKPILGTVFSGTVESTGAKVSRFKSGDRVFGMTGFGFGTHAAYLKIKEDAFVTAMPANATYEEAAALVFGGQTAVYFLDKLKVKKDDHILVIGSTGAVGSAAVQLAVALGAQVTAVCSTAGRTLMEALGIGRIICYDEENFLEHQEKFDAIFDAVGKTTKRQCRKLLKQGGGFKTVGGLEVAAESRQQLETLKRRYEAGALQAVIDKVYPLDQIVAAHSYVDSGRKKGNVVISIPD